MTEVIEVTTEQLDATISALEASHPDFVELWASKECCTSCLIPWGQWSAEKVAAFEQYDSARWLRGDTRPSKEMT